MEAHQLDAVHEARSAVGHQIRLALTPAGQGGGPFACPAQIEDLPASLQHAAVDVPHQQRGQLTGRGRDHDLVELCHALASPPELDQRTTT